MKKQLLFLPLALLLVAGGCGQKSGSADSSSKARVSSQAKVKRTKKAQPSKKAQQSSATKTSSQASSSSGTATKASTPAPAHLATVKAALLKQLPGAKFPSTDIAPSGQALNVAATGKASAYTLFFSFGTPQAYQASGLPTATAPYVLKKTTPTASQADAAINWRAPQTGLPTVALGDSLTGTEEGAAGSSYVTWHEGRWSLVAIGVNQNHEDPVALAKQAVAYLAQVSLPIPAVHGAVELHVAKTSGRVNTVSWRDASGFYQLSGSDPLQTLRLAASLK